jgi:alkanesulfonate monooxygenase SsuD/methylene tetrahydromethanopterin reductase-like flavin-dependent oxidoreductase (luciferase family)
MRIGISVTSLHRVRDPREGARMMLERTRAAREAGLDSLFFGDHHATALPYYQNTPMLGRALAEWDARPAGALYLLPLWHPVLLAEQVATLASVAQGRFILQCAIGPDDEQFPAFGVCARERVPRFEETLALLRRLWAGERVTHRGHHELTDARIAPLPPEPIEVWIGAVASRAIDRAARLGEGWLAAPALPLEGARVQLERYRECCALHGRRPLAVLRRDVFVGRDDIDARRTVEPILAQGYRGFPPDALAVGDVARVADAFARLAEMGYAEILIRNIVQEQKHALSCIERLGEVRERLGSGLTLGR